MRCDEAQKLLDNFFDLGVEERKILIEHCDKCPICSEELNLLENFSKHWKKEIPSLTERDRIKILTGIHSSRQRWRSPIRLAYITASIAGVISIGIIMFFIGKNSTTNGFEFTMLATEELTRELAQKPNIASEFINEYSKEISIGTISYFEPEEIFEKLSQTEQTIILEKLYQSL